METHTNMQNNVATNEPIEFEKQRIQIQDSRTLPIHLEEVMEYNEENPKINM